jgi:uncharacterized protein YjbI with pentapeptide repeats/uncharacterized protein (DUF697 family)/tellurite resistance protein
MVHNFSNQRLRGKSFQGQDLAGANFAASDLRGVNFARANLTDANFTGAHMGLPPWRRGLLLACLGLGAIATGVFAFGLDRVVLYLQSDRLETPQAVPLLLGSLAFLITVTLRLGVDDLNKWLMRFLVVLVILVSMILGGHPDWGNAVTMVALGIAVTVGLVQYVALLAAIAETIAGAIECAALSAVAVMVIGWLGSSGLTLGIAVGAIALGTFLGVRSRRDDAVIHRGAIALSSLGGTCFKQSNLTNANFSQANLNSSDFRQAVLKHARFYQAENLDQARVGQSLPQVRALLVSLDGRGQSFVEADLSGADLGGADLSGADLSGADLSEADLRDANLENAILVRTNAITADFRRAQFTGACVADWNIDRSTQLESVDCRYLYLATQKRERLPSLGEWTQGECTRHFTVRDRDQGSVFDGDLAGEAINPQEVLASLMVLVRLAIADHDLEAMEREMLLEALSALELGEKFTLEQLLDDRISFDELLGKLHSPIIRERVYQSAYLMARLDGELEPGEVELLDRIQTKLEISAGKIEKLQTAVSEAQALSIAEQVAAINDPEKREAAVNTNIRLMALMHAFSGAMPIPGFAIVTHLMIYKDQVELVQKIGRIWGYPGDHKHEALNQALFGTVGATAARVALSNVALLIPVWGSVIGASTAFSMTWAIGELAQKFFASGGQLDERSLKDQLLEAKAAGQKVFQESQEAIGQQQRAIAAKVQELQGLLQGGKIDQQEYMARFRRDLEDDLGRSPGSKSGS